MARSILDSALSRKQAGGPGSTPTAAPTGALARPRPVRCYHCDGQFTVSPHARNGPCPRCYKRLLLDDLVVQPTTRPLPDDTTLTTCGLLVVEAQAACALAQVNAMDGVDVSGKLDASVRAAGAITVDSRGSLKGQLDAPAIVVRPGGTLIGMVRTGKFAARAG